MDDELIKTANLISDTAKRRQRLLVNNIPFHQSMTRAHCSCPLISWLYKLLPLSLPAIPIIIVHYHQPSITWYTNYRELYSAYNYPSSHHVPPLNLMIAAASSDCPLISPSCLWSVPSAVTCHRKCAIMVNFILITFPHLVLPEYYS